MKWCLFHRWQKYERIVDRQYDNHFRMCTKCGKIQIFECDPFGGIGSAWVDASIMKERLLEVAVKIGKDYGK